MNDAQVNRLVNAIYNGDVATVQSYTNLYYIGQISHSSSQHLSDAISQVHNRKILLTLITNGYDVNLHGQGSILNKVLRLKDSELIKLCLNKSQVISKIMLDRDRQQIELCLKSEHQLFANGALQYIFRGNQTESVDWELLKLFLNCGGNVQSVYVDQIMLTKNKEIIELCLKSEQDANKHQTLVNSALQFMFNESQRHSVDCELLKLCLNNGGNAQCVIENVMLTKNKEIIELCLKSEQDANKRQSLVNSALQFMFNESQRHSVDCELLKLCLNNGGNAQYVIENVMLTKNKEIIELCLKSEQDANKRQSLVNRALQFMFNESQRHSVDCELLKLCLNNGGNAQCVIANVMLTNNKEIIELCLKSEQDANNRQSLASYVLKSIFIKDWFTNTQICIRDERTLFHNNYAQQQYRQTYNTCSYPNKCYLDRELLTLCLNNGGDVQSAINEIMLTEDQAIVELCLKSEKNADKLQSLATAALRCILNRNKDQLLMDSEIIKFCLYNRGSVQNNDVGNIMRKGDKEILELWLKSEQDEKKLKTFVDSALQYIFDGSKKYDLVEITKLLSANGANMDVVYQCKRYPESEAHTLLIEACKQGHISLVRTLLTECVADVNCVTTDNGPLHAAIKSTSIDIVTFLLAQPKIDVNQQILSTLEAPLHVASKLGDVRFVKMLLDKGANKNIYNLKGQYPCDVAHESVGKYYHKLLVVDSLVSVEERLIIFEHKLTQSLEYRLPQLDLKITELIRKYEDNEIRMQKRIDEMFEKLQENEKKMLDMESQQTRLASRKKLRYKPT